MSGVRLKDLLDRVPGSLSESEALALFRAARLRSDGALVNNGPCNDKAAVALVVGHASLPADSRPAFYCVEPESTGKGGSRRSLEHTLGKMGCEGLANLIVTPGAEQLAAWRDPVSVLRLQTADYASMRTQVDRWLPFLTPAASIVIQGPPVDKAGRKQLVAELESSERFLRFENMAGLVELRRVDPRRTISVPANSSAMQVAKQYSLELGDDEPMVLGRFLHGSFVSSRHRYVYMEIPKAACTTMKYFIVALEQAACQFERVPYLRETKQSMLIHQRQYVGVPTLLDLSGNDLHTVLSGRSGHFIFALVRNPYSRLVSAFESKVRLAEPGMRQVFERRWAAAEAGDDVRRSFAEFVRTDLEGLVSSAQEHHFVPQHRLLVRQIIPYSKIFQVERFKEFEYAFAAHLKSCGVQTFPKFRDYNRSFYPDWRHYYDRETAERVFDFFEADFEPYGYDPESWRSDEAPRDLRTSAVEAYWRMEVIERNEMIDFLYGFLRGAK
jgi:hypothetical protein